MSKILKIFGKQKLRILHHAADAVKYHWTHPQEKEIKTKGLFKNDREESKNYRHNASQVSQGH